MDKVKYSLQQFSDSFNEQSIADKLERIKLSDSNSNDKNCNKAFSQRAAEFLKNFEQRKYNQLVKLSTLNVS